MKPPFWDRIFHPTDFSAGDEGALAHALKLAVSQRAGLDLMHSGPKNEEVSWEDFPRVRGILERWGVVRPGISHKEMRDTLGLDVKKIRKSEANVVQSIVNQIAQTEPDLVVLATHQRQGIERLVKGSVAEPIAREAGGLTLFVPRQVKGFVARATGEIQLKNILVPIDHSPRPQTALDAAVEMAHAAGVSETNITLLHVGPESNMPRVRIPVIPGYHFERAAWEGNVVDHILAAAGEHSADLIVMATHGHDGFLDAFRGSTTERTLRNAKCPLLAARV